MTANEVLVAGESSNAIVTHDILLRPGIRVRASSSSLGWRGIAASVQSERPFSGSYGAASDHLVVLHVGRPARVAGRTAGNVDKMIPPGHFFLWPGGQSLNVELRDPTYAWGYPFVAPLVSSETNRSEEVTFRPGDHSGRILKGDHAAP